MVDVAVIVPVAQRPHNAAPFMESLEESTHRCEVYAIADAGDTETWETWEAVGARTFTHHWPGRIGSFSQKVNIGSQVSDEEWLFIVGDDGRFHAGWLDAALLAALETGAHVIGTAGSKGCSDDFSPHLLISRDYVELEGASWDGPGSVCHEGYRHNYVDLEIIAVAQQRGVWTMAWGSVVEHLHPFFGTAPDDAIYRLGQSTVDADAALWNERRAKYAA